MLVFTQAQIAEKQRKKATEALDRQRAAESAKQQEESLKATIETALAAPFSAPSHNRRKFDW